MDDEVENKNLSMNRQSRGPRQCRIKNSYSPSKISRRGKRSHRHDSSGSSRTSSISSNTPREPETDPVILERRQKQIDYGKNTLDYDTYSKKVPKETRPYFLPKTPEKNLKYSRRQWDGSIKAWKLRVHDWNKKGLFFIVRPLAFLKKTRFRVFKNNYLSIVTRSSSFALVQ